MRRIHRAYVIVALAAGAMVLSGCGSVASSGPRTLNQGGGSLLSAGVKIAQGDMTDLTADEVQILADNFLPDGSPELTDEQAAGIVEFLALNSLDSLDDIQSLMNGGTDLSSIDWPDGFLELWSNLSFDNFL